MRKSTTDEQSPAFQFYAGDWISDPSRLKMSLEEQGAYVLLHCHCWRGFKIILDYEIMARMCNCTLNKIKEIFPKNIDLNNLDTKESTEITNYNIINKIISNKYRDYSDSDSEETEHENIRVQQCVHQ